MTWKSAAPLQYSMHIAALKWRVNVVWNVALTLMTLPVVSFLTQSRRSGIKVFSQRMFAVVNVMTKCTAAELS